MSVARQEFAATAASLGALVDHSAPLTDLWRTLDYERKCAWARLSGHPYPRQIARQPWQHLSASTRHDLRRAVEWARQLVGAFDRMPAR